MTLADSIRRSIYLIEPSLRPLGIWLVVVALVASILEAAGVGMIFLVFAVVQGTASSLPPPIRLLVGDTTQSPQAIVTVCGLLLGILAAKSVFVLFSVWLKSTFLMRMQASLAGRLMRRYLARPLAFHIRANSSDLVHNTINASYTVTHSCIGSLIDLVVDLLTLFAVISLLLWISPAATAVAIIGLGMVGTAFLWLARERFARWGAIVNERLNAMQRVAVQAFQGIKTIKAIGCEDKFAEVFDHNLDSYGRYRRRGVMANNLPRHGLELALAAALLGTLSVVVLAGKPAAAVVPYLALLGAAAYRVMPALIRMSTSFQALRFGGSELSTVYGVLASKEFVTEPHHPKVSAPPHVHESIEFVSVSYSYDGGDGAALSDVNFDIKRGEVIAFTGPSGAGKTTLVDILLGLLKPSKGTMRLDGIELADFSALSRSIFGYVSQDTFIIDDTLRTNVALGASKTNVDDERVRTALRDAALGPFLESLADGLDTGMGDRGARLSGGQRQRLGIARALWTDPDILVLDEPTSALDGATEGEILSVIQRMRRLKTIVIITHRLSLARTADRIYHMMDGRIVDVGSYDELMQRNANFQELAQGMQ